MSQPYTPEELHQITLRNRTHPEEFEDRDDIRFCDHCGSAMAFAALASSITTDRNQTPGLLCVHKGA